MPNILEGLEIREESEEVSVRYKSLYGEGITWNRKLSEWLKPTEKDGVDDEDSGLTFGEYALLDFYGGNEDYLHGFQEVITSYILDNPELTETPTSISYESIGEHGEIELTTESGIILNNLLPEHMSIVMDAGVDEFYAHVQGNRVVFSEGALSLGLYSNITIAHEFGHALTPNADAISIVI